MEEKILEIEDLNKKFGRKQVLIDFNLSLRRGEVYGLLGKNGEGKTTLSRILMGVIPPDSGSINFNGKPLNFRQSAYKKSMALIAEDSIFYGWMTIGALLEFNSAFFPQWRAGKVDEYLKRFSLDPKVKIKNLSRGMKLKVGLIAALASAPEMLILDDPTSGLDVPTRHDFLKSIIREIVNSGTTILFSSHLVHEIEGIIDRLGILNHGKMILDEDFKKVKDLTRRITLGVTADRLQSLNLEGVLSVESLGDRCQIVVYPWTEKEREKIKSLNPGEWEEEALNLEEMFIHFVSEI